MVHKLRVLKTSRDKPWLLMLSWLMYQAGQEEAGEDGLLLEMAEVKKRMEQRNKRDKKKTKEQKKRSRIRAAQLALGGFPDT